MNLVAESPLMQRCFLSTLLVCGFFFSGQTAQAEAGRPDEAQLTCVHEHRQAQESRQAGRLLEAKRLLEACLHPSCNSALRQDCDGWLAEVSALIPSLVLSAESADGDLHRVEVWDGEKRIASELHGRPIPFDPGPHQLRFQREGCEPVEQMVVLSSGERGRLLRVRLCEEHGVVSPRAGEESDGESSGQAKAPASPNQASAPGASSHPAVSAGSGLPQIDKVLLASSAVLAGAGIGFSIWSYAEYREAESSCAPLCSESEVQKVRTLGLVADVAFALTASTLAIVGVRYFHRRAQLRVGARNISIVGQF